MEINFENSATKRYLENSPLPKREREFLTDCAREVFSVFGVNCKNLRHNGQRFYLGGQFHNFCFNPLETVAMNIYRAGHIKTFKNDRRAQISVFGPLCFIHPFDLIYIDSIFSPQSVSTFNMDSKPLQMSMVLLLCSIVRNIEMGRTKITVNFEDSDPTQSRIFKALLCLIFHGGLAFDGHKVRNYFLFY